MFKRVHFVICCWSFLSSSTSYAQASGTFNPTQSELEWSTSVSQLGVSAIHARGVLGRGIVVAVLDTGVNIQHAEFANSGRLLTGFNGVNGSTDVTDSNGHGTHVAGVVAASADGNGMYGVAPGATLLPIKVFNGGTAPASAVTAGLDYAINHGARVINLSLGTTSPTGDTGLKRVAATNQAVVVIAAGNEGAASPNWPGRYAQEAWANGTLLVVGSVNAQHKISNESNRAGALAPFYLVAPGVNIISAYGNNYSYMTGTSMAAPAVSGAAALITGYWPYLRANQVSTILLKTADDLGAPGVDAIYGHGMLNVERALAPIGAFRYRTMNGTVTQIDLSTPGIRSAQPSISTPTSFQDITTEAFDDYGRNYTRNEGALVSSRTALTTDAIMDSGTLLVNSTQTILPNGGQVQALSVSDRATPTQSRHMNTNSAGGIWNHGEALSHALLSWRAPSGASLATGTGATSPMALGLGNAGWRSDLSPLNELLQHPLARYATQHQFASMASPVMGGWRIQGATLQGAPQHGKGAQGQVNLLELLHQTERWAIQLSSAQLNEKGLLGGYSNDVMGLNQRTQTRGWSVSGAYALSRQWALAGNWSHTQTQAPQAQGLLVSASDILAHASGLGIVRADWLTPGDRMSLSWQTPLSATSGQLTYNVVSEVDESGTPHFVDRTIQLSPSHPQQTWNLRYARPTGPRSSLSTALSIRTHPDHDAQAKTQWAWGIRYTLAL